MRNSTCWVPFDGCSILSPGRTELQFPTEIRRQDQEVRKSDHTFGVQIAVDRFVIALLPKVRGKYQEVGKVNSAVAVDERRLFASSK